MGRLLLILRTVRHLKAIQVLNRIWRKRPLGDVSRTALTSCEIHVRTAFPCGYRVWDGASTFTFLNETYPLRDAADWNAADRKKLGLYNLHYFDCLRQGDGETAARGEKTPPEDRRNREQDLMLRWIDENPVGHGNGWEPYPISLRVVNWIKWYLSSSPSIEQSEQSNNRTILLSLAIQVRWLVKRLEYHLLANHLLANAKALVFAGAFFAGDEAKAWLKKGMDIYRRELPEQVLGDGVHFELSAMYHSIILEDLLDCYNLTGDEFFAPWIGRMLAGLKLLTGPDGKIAKFNDAAEGIALTPETLTAYAHRLAPRSKSHVRRCKSNKRSGIVRLRKGNWTLIAKCGEIGPSYQPGHAHADTGSFELWKGTEKIITDTGTDRYVIDAERKRQRGTAAHSTVMVNGVDSSEVWAGHRVARRATCRILEVSDSRVRLAWVDYRGARVRRTLELTDDGVMGLDEVEVRGESNIVDRWHFAPGAEGVADLTVENASVVWEEDEVAAEFGKLVPCRQAMCRLAASLPVQIKWKIA